MPTILGTQNIFKQFNKIAGLNTQESKVGQDSFMDVLKSTMQSGVEQAKTNERLASAHALGEADLTQLTTETAKLAVNFEIYTGLREKLLAAHQELIKMSI